MRPMIAISILLLTPGVENVLLAQPAATAAAKSLLILLRQPEGTLGKRLAELPSSTPVPEEVRAAALREQTSMAQAQQESFDQRMAAAGVTQVVHYPELNMVRAEVPPAALSLVQSDPAVISVTPLSEDAPAIAGVKSPPAGLAAGLRGLRSDALQPPSFASALPPAAPPMSMPSLSSSMLPGMPMPGLPGSAGMFQSLLGVGGQMGMQAGSAMPRAAGFAMLFSGTAQITQAILANRKPACSVTMATAATQLPETGGQGVIAVSAPPSCLWQANSDAAWLQINTEGPMMGPGIVRYTTAPATPGMLRTGVINVVGVDNSKVKGKTSITVRQGQ